MISFFTHAPGNQRLSGPPETVAEELGGGMIKADTRTGKRRVFLYLTGKPIAAYRLTRERIRALLAKDALPFGADHHVLLEPAQAADKYRGPVCYGPSLRETAAQG